MAPRSLPFFYVDSNYRLSVQDTAHFLKVLRQKQGDLLTVSDGEGRVWTARAGGRKDGHLVTVPEGEPHVEQPFPIHVATAAAKGHRMAFLVEKAAELGASSITPILTNRAAVRKVSHSMVKRWNLVARSGGKQSRSPWICRVHSLETLENLLESERSCAVLDPDGTIEAWDTLMGPDPVTLLVGPEGGWSDREKTSFREKDLPLLSLPSPVIRIETAVVAGLVTCRLAFQRWKDGKVNPSKQR